VKSKRNHIDVVVLIAVLLLMVISIGTVYSASSTWALERTGNPGKLMTNHVISVLIGIVVLFVFMNLPYRFYKKISLFGIVLTALLLMGTLIWGSEIKGATRWIQLGPVNFQPSEVAKFALVVHICVLLERKKKYLQDWKRTLFPMGLWLGLIVGLVMLQPNFSMAALILLITVATLYLGRIPLRHLVIAGFCAVPVLAVYFMSAEYRLRRLLGFISADGGDAGISYQMSQGIIAFGSGGLLGVGPGASKQRDFFLPESYGDYIFAIFGEEYGFIGTAFVIIVFTVLLLRGFRIALNINDDFGKLLAGSITVALSIYAIINGLITTGLMPTTGLPMPFLSYGGTAMIVNAAAVGILLNISSYTDLRPKLSTQQAVPSLQLNRVQ
jgi:cell division protein FtsW